MTCQSDSLCDVPFLDVFKIPTPARKRSPRLAQTHGPENPRRQGPSPTQVASRGLMAENSRAARSRDERATAWAERVVEASASGRDADTGRYGRLLRAIEHAFSCRRPTCNSTCERIKRMHAHANRCGIPMLVHCLECRRLWALLTLHARRCCLASGECNVPFCQGIRERVGKIDARGREVLKDCTNTVLLRRNRFTSARRMVSRGAENNVS